MFGPVRGARVSSAGDALTTYLDAIGEYRLLTRDEENGLAIRIRAGETEALEQLVCANLRFVVSVAKKYQTRGVPLSDLINEGNLGLIQAAQRFDESKGVKFISYAVWWIRQAIHQALADQSHTVRVPVGRLGAFLRLGRRAEELRQELGREPTQDELAASAQLTEEELTDMLPLARRFLSLDAPMGDDGDGKLLDHLPDDASAAPDETVDLGLIHSIEQAFAHLLAREVEILRLYFGFDGKDPMTLESIGARMGVTRERARQIKERALLKLRKSKQVDLLLALHEG
jgi:RNA polymerase primary sigma factor